MKTHTPYLCTSLVRGGSAPYRASIPFLSSPLLPPPYLLSPSPSPSSFLLPLSSSLLLYLLLPLIPHPVAPIITQGPISSAAVKGTLTQLQCLWAGLPPPTITWWKSNGDVSVATQVQPSSSVVISGEYLVITTTSMLDIGYYYCNLSSPLGVVTSPQTYINVYGKSL